MKKIRLLQIAAILCLFAFEACKKGDTGDPGQPGSNGQQGPKGATGDSTLTKAIYSPWIPVTASNWVFDSITFNHHLNPNNGKTETDTVAFYHAMFPTPKLTKDVMDKGFFFFYLKDDTYPWTQNPIELPNVFDVGATNNNGVYPTWTDFETYNFYYPKSIGDAYHDLIQTSYEINLYKGYQPDSLRLVTLWYTSSNVYDAQWIDPFLFPNRVKYTDLPPSTNFSLRYVIIPGEKPVQKTLVNVDFKNYQAVKQYYHIPD